MFRKITLVCSAFLMLFMANQSQAQKGKSELALGYGYWSIYNLANGVPYNQSSGTFSLTYRYYITKNVTLGMGFGSENINNYGSMTTIAPELTACYMDTKDSRIRVRLYGSASYGITIFNDNDKNTGHVDQSAIWAYAFQATPFGIRIGRQLAFFTELGIGYKGLFHSGLDLRVPRSLKHRPHHTAE
jgi:Outer membrane protein beta-barrel domain